MFAKQWYSLILLDRGNVRPQKLHHLAIMEDGDVLGAHVHRQSELLVADSEAAKVGQCARRTIWTNIILANNLPIYRKT